jgi:hypothetical protein
MPLNTEPLLKRAREVLAQPVNLASASEPIQFATSMLTALHGAQSTQLKVFLDGCAAISKNTTGAGNAAHHLRQHAHGAIKNAIAEVEGGLIVSLRAQVAGEILGELVGLGKETLEDDTESAKNVSAVLIAAAFEDLMRRMGSELAGVTGRPKLEEVLTALKNADVLKGGEVGTAQSYLKFRNDSLHADWTKVHKSQVQSCTAFIEALLVKHFS